MADDFAAPNFEEKSNWSMDVSTLNRINYLLWTCNVSSERDDVVTWYKALTNLYKEGVTYLNKRKDKKDYFDLKIKITASYNNYMRYLNYYNSLSDKDKRLVGSDDAQDIYGLLEQFEIKMRILLDDAGLLMKKETDARFVVR